MTMNSKSSGTRSLEEGELMGEHKPNTGSSPSLVSKLLLVAFVVFIFMLGFISGFMVPLKSHFDESQVTDNDRLKFTMDRIEELSSNATEKHLALLEEILKPRGYNKTIEKKEDVKEDTVKYPRGIIYERGAAGKISEEISLTCEYGVITIQDVFVMRVRAMLSALKLIQEDCDKHTTTTKTISGAHKSTCSVNFDRFLKFPNPEEATEIVYTCSISLSTTVDPWQGYELGSGSSKTFTVIGIAQEPLSLLCEDSNNKVFVVEYSYDGVKASVESLEDLRIDCIQNTIRKNSKSSCSVLLSRAFGGTFDKNAIVKALYRCLPSPKTNPTTTRTTTTPTTPTTTTPTTTTSTTTTPTTTTSTTTTPTATTTTTTPTTTTTTTTPKTTTTTTTTTPTMTTTTTPTTTTPTTTTSTTPTTMTPTTTTTSAPTNKLRTTPLITKPTTPTTKTTTSLKRTE